MKLKGLILIFILQLHNSWAQNLERKIFFGIMTTELDQRILIDSILKYSTAEKLGLQKNDFLLSINNQYINTTKQLNALLSELRANRKIEIQFQRGGNTMNVSTTSISKPLIEASWCNIRYLSLPAIGCTLRTIIYNPKKKGLTPGIFFIPGYNCGSIENYPTNYNGKLIEYWVKHGYSVYTVEKSGIGDSYGCRPCVEVDLQTDIELFKTAYKDFASLPFLDKDNLFIWGHSMGGIIAPIIAQNERVKGIMVYGTVFRPWSEFLLEMHRVQKPLTDSLSPAKTEDFIRLIQKVYYDFFVLKKTPAELYQIPFYKAIVESELEYKPGKDEMWGRHWRFWQQLDSIDLAQQWQNLNCKVLVLHGSSDYIQCSSLEPYLIATSVNQVHPNNAKLIILKGIDHLMMHSKDYQEAIQHFNQKEYTKGNFNSKVAKETTKWIKRMMRSN